MTTSEQNMVGRRVRSGYTERESRDLLRNLCDAHTARTRPAALAYHGFVTIAEAERMSARLEVAARTQGP